MGRPTTWAAVVAAATWAVVATTSWSSHPTWHVAAFFLIPVWESFYFYWIHRLLHWPPLYRAVHRLHHRNTNVGPWSGLSMHPVEHVIFLGGVVLFCFVPASPVHVLFCTQYFALTAATTHAGFEGLVMRDKNRLNLGTFHHQIGLLGDIAGRIDDFVRAPDANVAPIIMSNPVQSKGINQAAQTLFQTRSRMNRMV